MNDKSFGDRIIFLPEIIFDFFAGHKWDYSPNWKLCRRCNYSEQNSPEEKEFIKKYNIAPDKNDLRDFTIRG